MKPEQRLLRIIGLMENFQNSNFEGLSEQARDQLLKQVFHDSMQVIRDAVKLLRIYREMSLSLNAIASYHAPQKIMKKANFLFGVDGAEAIVLAYENVLAEAKNGLRRARYRKGEV